MILSERKAFFVYLSTMKIVENFLDKIKEKTSFGWKCDFIRFFCWSSMWGFLTNQTTLWGFSEQSVTNIKGCRWLIWRCGYIWTKFHLTHLMKTHFLKVYESSLDQPKWLRFLDPTDATWEIPERRENVQRKLATITLEIWIKFECGVIIMRVRCSGEWSTLWILLSVMIIVKSMR